MNPPQLESADALIVVDVQRDFCPGGALPVERGREVVPVLNRWLDAASAGEATVVASRDWHPANHISFRDRGGPWPIHCVQNTPGAEFHPDLKLAPRARIVSKAADPDRDSYSAFDGTGLAEELQRRGVRRLWVGGLALDYCVRATVLDGLQAGFEVHLIKDAARAVDLRPGDGERVVAEMRDAGAIIEEGGANAAPARGSRQAADARGSAPLGSVHRSVRANDGPGV